MAAASLKRPDGSVRLRAQAGICFTLAFLTGYVDVITYLRWHAFAAMMTGNLLLFSRNLAGDNTSGLLHLSIILAYVAGIAVYKVISKKVSHRTALAFAPFLAVCILLVEFLDWWTNVEQHPRYLVVAMAPIFAVQTTLSLEAGLSTVTASVTAHTHNLMRCIFQLLICELGAEDFRKLTLSLSVILGVACGAFVGAVASTQMPDERCSMHPACQAAHLEGLCCPTETGEQMDCCEPGRRWHYRLLLVPVSPLVAITLIFYDYAFRGSFCGKGGDGGAEGGAGAERREPPKLELEPEASAAAAPTRRSPPSPGDGRDSSLTSLTSPVRSSESSAEDCGGKSLCGI